MHVLWSGNHCECAQGACNASDCVTQPGGRAAGRHALAGLEASQHACASAALTSRPHQLSGARVWMTGASPLCHSPPPPLPPLRPLHRRPAGAPRRAEQAVSRSWSLADACRSARLAAASVNLAGPACMHSRQCVVQARRRRITAFGRDAAAAHKAHRPGAPSFCTEHTPAAVLLARWPASSRRAGRRGSAREPGAWRGAQHCAPRWQSALPAGLCAGGVGELQRGVTRGRALHGRSAP